MTELHRLAENESRLRHGTLRRIDEQENAVYHLEYALDLSAEVCVPGGIYYVYSHIAADDRRVFRKYRDSALAFEIAGVHDALRDLLIFVVFAALLQHFVHKRGLTVIDVCDYRNVAQICSYQKYLSVSFLYFCLF